MKTTQGVARTVGIVSVVMLTFQIFAHSGEPDIATAEQRPAADTIRAALAHLQPPSLQTVPEYGTFFMLSDYLRFEETNFPPIPFNRCPNCPTYRLGSDSEDVFLVDDAPLTTVTGFSANSGEAADFILHNTSSDFPYTIQVPSIPSGQWKSRKVITGSQEGDWTSTSFLNSNRTAPLFFRAHVGADPLSLWLEVPSDAFAVSGQFKLIIHNTIVDQPYELLTKQSLSESTWTVEPVEVIAINEDTSITLALNGRTTLFVQARLGGSSNGKLIPDWWLLKYFGTTGVDPFALDSSGDGWTILQDYQNGFVPGTWNTPPAPQGLTVNYNLTNGVVGGNWTPNPGNVTGYTVEKYDEYLGTTSNSSSTTASFSDSVDDPPIALAVFGPTVRVSYRVRAHYPGGDSAWSDNVWLEPTYDPSSWSAALTAYLIPGAQGSALLAVSALPPGATKVRLTRVDFLAEWNNGDSSFNTSFEIPISALTNGMYQLSSSLQTAPADSYGYNDYEWWLQAFDAKDNPSAAAFLGSGYQTANSAFHYAATPFFDGRQQLKQNLAFSLRAAIHDQPFSFALTWGLSSRAFTNFASYGYASFYDLSNGDRIGNNYFEKYPLSPFRDNYLYRNFVFSAADIDSNGFLTNGIGWNYGVALAYPTRHGFQGPATNSAAITALLSAAASQWSYYLPLSANSGTWDLSEIGVSYHGGIYSLAGNAKNIYGLPYLSAKIAYNDGSGLQVATLNAGGSVSVPTSSGYIYPETTQPQLQTVDYYFTQVPRDFPSSSALTPLPGQPDFSVTNTSPVLIAGFADPAFKVAGYAKQQINNGYFGVYGYLGQYFDKAHLMSNGVPIAIDAGIVSPYGDFFATMPGPVALVTMPDIDTGQCGTGVVNVVKLQLDVNHDGAMDLSFAGPDNTSAAHPFEFWINNDNDAAGKDRYLPKSPDSAAYTIQSQRDLEDFARLWIVGTPQLNYFPDNYLVNLTWRNITVGSPCIKIFRAVESDGGIGYLTSTNIANNQLASNVYLGTATNGSTFYFPLAEFESAADHHYLFEGVSAGKGELVLTITQNGKTVAQTSQWLDLHDVKDFYERTVIANTYVGAISNWSSVIDSVNPATLSAGTDPNLIILVHGIAVSETGWLTESDTVFKRLYWSGFEGKFASVRWPCTPITQIEEFNTSELNAYKASIAVENYLEQLHARFWGHGLHILAHSQGNAVASEAIQQGAPFDTYILTQAAVPANAYDINAPTYEPLTNLEGSVPTPEWQPSGYHGVYTNFTGRIVNFYNFFDPVLDTWILQQKLLKPNEYLFNGGNYYWDGTNGWHIFDPEHNGKYVVTDSQESRAMISRSRTLPIGQSGPQTEHGVLKSGVDLNASYGFYKAFPDDHSAQWTWPIQRTRPYYLEVLDKIKP